MSANDCIESIVGEDLATPIVLLPGAVGITVKDIHSNPRDIGIISFFTQGTFSPDNLFYQYLFG